jgi:hypothetical protein
MRCSSSMPSAAAASPATSHTATAPTRRSGSTGRRQLASGRTRSRAQTFEGPTMVLTDLGESLCLCSLLRPQGQDLEPDRAVGQTRGQAARRIRGGALPLGTAGGVGPQNGQTHRAEVRAVHRAHRRHGAAGPRAHLGPGWGPGGLRRRPAVRGPESDDTVPVRPVEQQALLRRLACCRVSGHRAALCFDKGYDDADAEAAARRRRFVPHIRRPRSAAVVGMASGRDGVGERTHS